MHVVVVYSWKKETPDLIQAISSALGIMPFEGRQLMIGGGPTVVANFANPQQAQVLAQRLNQNGISTLVVDAAEVYARAAHLFVRRFELNESSLHIETDSQQHVEISYGDIDMFLPVTSIVMHSEIETVTERKLSIGKTIMTGGIPMSRKVKHQEEVTNEERSKGLYLYTCNQQLVVFIQNSLNYDGLGPAVQPSREQNFAYLISELRQRSPEAIYDDRLNNRAGLVRLLGPTLRPENNLELAVEILNLSLRHGRP